ncbi:hypothetical protein CF336_g5618 [Tilletia laevis]|nr:hypothetical protein CF336_g5618 [Tilletia laevis]KAE8237651.1 hypothetical protein A4X03_0g9071 [Tilletia caries]
MPLTAREVKAAEAQDDGIKKLKADAAKIPIGPAEDDARYALRLKMSGARSRIRRKLQLDMAAARIELEKDRMVWQAQSTSMYLRDLESNIVDQMDKELDEELHDELEDGADEPEQINNTEEDEELGCEEDDNDQEKETVDADTSVQKASEKLKAGSPEAQKLRTAITDIVRRLKLRPEHLGTTLFPTDTAQVRAADASKALLQPTFLQRTGAPNYPSCSKPMDSGTPLGLDHIPLCYQSKADEQIVLAHAQIWAEEKIRKASPSSCTMCDFDVRSEDDIDRNEPSERDLAELEVHWAEAHGILIRKTCQAKVCVQHQLTSVGPAEIKNHADQHILDALTQEPALLIFK